MTKQRSALPTGQVLVVCGLKYRTLYNYLRDFGEFFSDSSRITKKGKRWTPNDLAVIQTIRHLHSERQSQAEIKQALTEGYITPMQGGYGPEDINRLIEASWLLVGDAEERLDKIDLLFAKCGVCEWQARQHLSTFMKTIDRYDQIDREVKQIRMIIGPLKDTKRARQERDSEYRHLHQELRFVFLAEEERRQEINRQQAEVVDDQKKITGFIRGLIPGGKKQREP